MSVNYSCQQYHEWQCADNCEYRYRAAPPPPHDFFRDASEDPSPHCLLSTLPRRLLVPPRVLDHFPHYSCGCLSRRCPLPHFPGECKSFLTTQSQVTVCGLLWTLVDWKVSWLWLVLQIQRYLVRYVSSITLALIGWRITFNFLSSIQVNL